MRSVAAIFKAINTRNDIVKHINFPVLQLRQKRKFMKNDSAFMTVTTFVYKAILEKKKGVFLLQFFDLYTINMLFYITIKV